MSPRALARAIKPLIPVTSTTDAAMAGQARPGQTRVWPEKRHQLRPGHDDERRDLTSASL
jgi:hypothetical protein